MLKSIPYYDIVQQPHWRNAGTTPITFADGAELIGDPRVGRYSDPNLFLYGSATAFYKYNTITDGWITLASSQTGTFGAGCRGVFHPSAGPKKTLAGGNTTTKVVLNDALTSPVGINQLADRGDDIGYRIRVIGLSAGKVEERFIAGNTEGSTPTITLDSPLTFTPQSGDKIEILSGRVYMLGLNPTSAIACTVTHNSAAVSSAALFGNVTAGMPVSGTGIVPGTYVQSVTDSSNITLNQPYVGVSSGGTVNLTFPFTMSTSGSITISGNILQYLGTSGIVAVPGMVIYNSNLNGGSATITRVYRTTVTTTANCLIELDQTPVTQGTIATQQIKFTGGGWAYYSIATNDIVGCTSPMGKTGNQTGLVVPTVDSYLLALSEDLVPYNKSPGQGFLGTITATGAGATSITGSVAGEDSGISANEYRNFQIRIVEDLVNPTSVGQRARITSHTAGPSPVFTVPTWSVTPSSSAKFVIENDDDKIIMWSAGTNTTLCYNISTDSWDSTTFAPRGVPNFQTGTLSTSSPYTEFVRNTVTAGMNVGQYVYGNVIPANTYITKIINSTLFGMSAAATSATGGTLCVQNMVGAGVMAVQPFGIARHETCKHSFIFTFSGGNRPTLDIFDIAGGATGSWSYDVRYGNRGDSSDGSLITTFGELFTTGSDIAYNPGTLEGKFAFLNPNASIRNLKFDMVNRRVYPYSVYKTGHSTARVGGRLEITTVTDSETGENYSVMFMARSNSNRFYNILLQ